MSDAENDAYAEGYARDDWYDSDLRPAAKTAPETCPHCGAEEGIGMQNFDLYECGTAQGATLKTPDWKRGRGCLMRELARLRSELAEANAHAGRLADALEKAHKCDDSYDPGDGTFIAEALTAHEARRKGGAV